MIVNDPRAIPTDPDVRSIQDLCEDHGFNVIIVGSNVDMQSAAMKKLMAIDGIEIRQQRGMDESRIGFVRANNLGRGPRNKWGKLK